VNKGKGEGQRRIEFLLRGAFPVSKGRHGARTSRLFSGGLAIGRDGDRGWFRMEGYRSYG